MDLNNITFCIPTFERPVECQGAINNILSLYPQARIVVADDSESPQVFEGIEYGIECHHDVGISWKRNKLLRTVQTPYVFLMDDDNYLQPGSVEALCAALEDRPTFALAGMAKHDMGRKRWANSEGTYKLTGTHLVIQKPQARVGQSQALLVNHLPMCFLARREIVADVGFDERYKTCGEHTDFFLRLAAANGHRGIRTRIGAMNLQREGDGPTEFKSYRGQAGCLFVPGPYFVDTASRNPTFKKARSRGSRYRKQMMARWGFQGIRSWANGKGRHVYEVRG